ncbi:prepilin-type N-terminal cleavage/methylation domain-containing protein [Thermodesulfobacteriota bacterium]
MMNDLICLKKSRGFTLLEIMIAIFILGIVLATIFGTFTGIISSSRNTENRVELYQTGRALMDLISMDIRGIFQATSENEGSFFIGVSEIILDQTMSKMDFVSTNSLQTGARSSELLSEVGYTVKKDRKSDLFSLWRRSQSPPESPYSEGGREVPVCRILESFKLEFILKNDRKKSLSNKIPDSIIIDFTLNLEGERENFVTMVKPMITN